MNRKILLSAALLLGLTAMAQPASFSAPRMLLQATTQGLMAPVWSPDGTKIAVTGDNYIGIWVANADGTGLRQVSDATGAGYQMTWADNSSLVSTPYVMVDSRRMTRVERVGIDGTVSQITPAERNFKRSRLARQASVMDIMTDDPANATTRIASLTDYAGKMVINPAMSPDGSKVAFQVVGKGVFVCNADGTGLVALGKGSHATWLPDNRHLMITRIEDNGEVFTHSDIYCIDIAGGNEMLITPETEVIPVTMAVSPDGSKLAFDNDTDGCIYVIDLKY